MRVWLERLLFSNLYDIVQRVRAGESSRKPPMWINPIPPPPPPNLHSDIRKPSNFHSTCRVYTFLKLASTLLLYGEHGERWNGLIQDIVDFKLKLIFNGEEQAKHDWNRTVISLVEIDSAVWKFGISKINILRIPEASLNMKNKKEQRVLFV